VCVCVCVCVCVWVCVCVCICVRICVCGMTRRQYAGAKDRANGSPHLGIIGQNLFGRRPQVIYTYIYIYVYLYMYICTYLQNWSWRLGIVRSIFFCPTLWIMWKCWRALPTDLGLVPNLYKSFPPDLFD